MSGEDPPLRVEAVREGPQTRKSLSVDEALPPPARAIVEAMACLGGRTDARLLQAATGEPAGAVVAGADPALDEGLLLSEPERSQLCGSATTGWAQGRSRS